MLPTELRAWCQVVYEESRMVSLTAPYVSGFLAFREVPFLLELVQQLREKEPGLMPQAGVSSLGQEKGLSFPLGEGRLLQVATTAVAGRDS